MRDARGRSRPPRRIGDAIGSFRGTIEPVTPLARIQTVWADAVGAGIAEVASPVAESGGVLTVRCESSVWASELALMETRIRERIAAALDGDGPDSIRFRTG